MKTAPHWKTGASEDPASFNTWVGSLVTAVEVDHPIFAVFLTIGIPPQRLLKWLETAANGPVTIQHVDNGRSVITVSSKFTDFMLRSASPIIWTSAMCPRAAPRAWFGTLSRTWARRTHDHRRGIRGAKNLATTAASGVAAKSGRVRGVVPVTLARAATRTPSVAVPLHLYSRILIHVQDKGITDPVRRQPLEGLADWIRANIMDRME